MIFKGEGSNFKEYNAKAFLKEIRPRAGDQVKVTGHWQSSNENAFMGKTLKIIKPYSSEDTTQALQNPNLQIKLTRKFTVSASSKDLGLCKFYTSSHRCFKGANCPYRHTDDSKERQVDISIYRHIHTCIEALLAMTLFYTIFPIAHSHSITRALISERPSTRDIRHPASISCNCTCC